MQQLENGKIYFILDGLFVYLTRLQWQSDLRYN